MTTTPTYLDLDTWPRRSAFELFRSYDIPCFNLCTRVDVALLKKAVQELGIGTMSLAYHFIAIRLGNDIEPFRYRLEGDRVRVHDVVHGGTTVLREDESIGLPHWSTTAALQNLQSRVQPHWQRCAGPTRRLNPANTRPPRCT